MADGTDREWIEIRGEIATGNDLWDKVDNHSLLNLFNVIEAQLAAIGDPALRPYQDFCLDLILELADRFDRAKIKLVERRFVDLAAELRQLAKRQAQHHAAVDTLLHSLRIGLCRFEELVVDRFVWQAIAIQTLEDKLTDFLSAAAAASRGKFAICRPPAAPAANEYQLDLHIHADGDAIHAPPLLLDLMRDLVANSRKYSPPGTCIRVQLWPQPPNGLRLEVADQGIGIPAAEIHKVVQFGYRASNAHSHRTMGGGFGLTKAYIATRKLNGRFYIASQPGEGTAVALTLFANGSSRRMP